jgi:DNA repair protein RecN (Recombination protein N)
MIKNYILIRHLEMGFDEGFSVITGETGSGKSILLGALGLILGQRADADALLNKKEKCIIEGAFNIQGYPLDQLFLHHDLDQDDVLIIRREINPAGKSRAFINDTPVALAVLKEFGERLVNIHSQHAVISLNDSNFQLSVLDSYAGLHEDVSVFRNEYSQYLKAKEHHFHLKERNSILMAERDYLDFLFAELKSCQLKPGELAALEEKLNLLRHSEEIQGNLLRSASILGDGEDNILESISEVIKLISQIVKYNPVLMQIVERLNSNYIDLKDVASELEIIREKVEVDPQEAELISQRLDQINRLLKKHNRKSTEELLELQEEISSKLNSADNLSEQIRELEQELEKQIARLTAGANLLSGKRKAAAPKFESGLTSIFHKVGMPHARFQISFGTNETPGRDGTDKIIFLFSANKGAELRDLSNTASGGELSRIMLGIKSMISQKNLLPTIIFDEIDSGVSGETAGKVGTILRSMGSKMQVIAITHLPQIAGKGDIHYRVLKAEGQETTETTITKLGSEDRIEEIARMLSNEAVTIAARVTARELLGFV